MTLQLLKVELNLPLPPTSARNRVHILRNNPERMEFPRDEEDNKGQNRLRTRHQYNTLEEGFKCSKQSAHLNNKKSVYPEIVSPHYASPLARKIGQ